jgi:flavin reductase (DIM6/NTAB) family NADH-FMN oxidoreductase RutF
MSTPQDHQRYRQVISHFATGVAVVTAAGQAGPAGLTANALCSLSLSPLSLLVCLENTARTLPLIMSSRRFAVNVLRQEQHALSGVFASKLPEQSKFDGVSWRHVENVPIIEGSLAWLICDLRETYPGGDHTICIGVVSSMHHEQQGNPLVWYRGRYGTLVGKRRAEAQLPN